MRQPFSIKYDEEADVLYISGSHNRPAIGREIVPGVLLRFAADDGELAGITVMDASKLTLDICCKGNVADAITQEREACAQIADQAAKALDNEWNRNLGKADDLVDTCEDIAAAIRARGSK